VRLLATTVEKYSLANYPVLLFYHYSMEVNINEKAKRATIGSDGLRNAK